MVKRIMFLLDYYIPNASPNGVCIEKIAKELIDNGWDVSVVCFRNKNESKREIRDGVKIYRICNIGDVNPNTGIEAVLFYLKWFQFSKYPITERKYVTKQLYDGAVNLLSENQYDAVVCIHLPVETLIVGTLLKELFPNLVVVSYMLDSLSGGFIPRFLPSFFTRRRKLIWENYLLKKVDKVILMESSRKHHEKHLNIEEWYQNSIYLDIPLLTKAAHQSPRKKRDNNTIITFCGLLNDPYRKVKHFLEIAKKCDQYCFVFAGQSNIESVFRTIQSEQIRYLGQIPHSRVNDLLENSDILLNLGVTVPSAISGKIFEYMSFGKPIISTYSIDNEACIPYLKKYDLGLLLDERTDDIEKQVTILKNFVDATMGKNVEYEDIEAAFYNNTPRAFVVTVEQTILAQRC